MLNYVVCKKVIIGMRTRCDVSMNHAWVKYAICIERYM